MMTKDGIHVNIIIMNKEPDLFTAFKHAFRGIKDFFITDCNGKLHLIAALLVIAAGVWLHISTTEWCLLLLCIAAVISIEMINAAIEKLCDLIHKDFHPSVKFIKDVSAGAVLVFSIISAVIGLIIFIPKIIILL
ncbi:diacylglycerol kinase family protein [soil metagenome]